jgi:DNA-binding MarR family transcriptional regulator
MASHVDPEASLGFALKRLQQRLRARMDGMLAEFGLTTPQYAVLALLAENPGITNAELARRSFVAPPTMIRMVTALEETGLIARDVPEGRMKRTELTDEGRARFADAALVVQGVERQLHTRAGDNFQVISDWLNACAADLET